MGVELQASQDYFNLIVYAPALMHHAGRPLAVVHGMERSLHMGRLGWTTSESGDLIQLPDRDAWVEAHRTADGFPFLCNDDDNLTVTLTGWESPAGPQDPPPFEIHARLPVTATVIAAAMDVLEAVAEGARAHWGQLTPFGAAGDIAEQTAPTLNGQPSPPRGLPALRGLPHIHAPAIPHYLGWLNYWSEASARALGFPDPIRDVELLSRSRRTATGGWVIQLTDAPLDLNDSTHLDALKRTYELFPRIGGRDTVDTIRP